jgi:16S rRNA (guanine527-N7)-methyltransferase
VPSVNKEWIAYLKLEIKACVKDDAKNRLGVNDELGVPPLRLDLDKNMEILKSHISENEFKEFDTNINVLDVGSGAGFPGVPIKIAKPEINLSLLEASLKKSTFLKSLSQELKIPFEVINERAEDYSKKHQELYDIIIFRAVGDFNTFLEICIPMLKKNGFIVALKSQNYQNEINLANRVLKILKSNVKKTIIKELPFEKGFRSVIIINKNEHVHGFPRKFSVIKNKGL